MKHKLIGFLFASFIVINILTPFVPAKVFAAPSVTVEDEYKIWRSYLVVDACLQDTFKVSGNSKQDIADSIFANKTTNGGIVTSQDLSRSMGKMYMDMIGLDSYDFGCRVLEDIEPALSALGYGSVYDFSDAINIEANKSGDVVQKEKVHTLLQEKVKSQGARLALNQQADAQFWFFNKLFRTSKDKGGCGGALGNDRSDSKQTAVKGTYWAVSGSGSATKYDYANYDLADNTNVEGIDGYFTELLSVSTPNCTQIAEQLTEARAKAYAQRVKDASGTDAKEPDTTEDGAATTDGAKTCSEQFGFSTAWLVCGILELISNGVDKLFDYADSLLNIDAQAYYGNENLRTVWSYFRAIATFLLLAVGLVMIISQAIGGNG